MSNFNFVVLKGCLLKFSKTNNIYRVTTPNFWIEFDENENDKENILEVQKQFEDKGFTKSMIKTIFDVLLPNVDNDKYRGKILTRRGKLI